MGTPLTLSSLPALTPYIQYVAGSGQTVFPYPFPITQDSDLVVIANGVTLATDAGYTLSGQGNPLGGNLTFTVGRTAGDIITLFRNVAIQRITQISQNSGFDSTAFNAEFNNIYLILQQLQESLAFALQVPNTNNPAPTTTLAPGTYANKYLSFDANGNPTPAVLTSSGTLTAQIVGGLIYARTADEITAGVVPTNLFYPPNPVADVRRYGALQNGSTDDTAAFVAANSVLAINGGVLQFSGTPLLNSASISIPKNVVWRGPQANPGIDNPVASGTYLQNGTLILNPTYTLQPGNKAGITNCTILNKNLSPLGTYPLPLTGSTNATNAVAAFAGTAITATGDDVLADTLLVLGFAQAFSSTGYERTRIHRMYGDNTAGIIITTSTDVARIEDCHFWPFLTAHQSWTTGALSARSGSAYKITLHYDTGNFINCFSYGYAIGFDIQSNNEVNIVNCFADGGSIGTGQIGMKFTGTAELIEVLGGGSSGLDQGVYCNVTPSSTAGAISLNGAQFWGNYAHVVSDSHRILRVQNCFLRDTNGGSRIGITINSGVGSNLTFITHNAFDAVSTAYSINAAAAPTCTIGPNSYNTNVANTVSQQFVYDGNSSTINHTKYSATANPVIINGQTARGTAALPTGSKQSDNLLNLQGWAYDGSTFGVTAAVRFTLRADASAGSTPGGIVFSTSASGASTLTDRVLINENGNLVPVVDNTYSCGATSFRWSTVWAANGSIQTSDARAKVDVADASLGMNLISLLRPVSYKFAVGGNKIVSTKEDGTPVVEQVPGKRTHYGMLAQDVKAALDKLNIGDFAGWVQTDMANPDSEQGLRYEQFIPVLIKAVQELAAEVAALKAK